LVFSGRSWQNPSERLTLNLVEAGISGEFVLNGSPVHWWRLARSLRFRVAFQSVQLKTEDSDRFGTIPEKIIPRCAESRIQALLEARFPAGVASPEEQAAEEPSQKECRVPRSGTKLLLLKVSAELRKRMGSQCKRQGLKLADEIQAALEAHFPAGVGDSPEEPVGGPAAEEPSQAA
jgi:hypothetical protein